MSDSSRAAPFTRTGSLASHGRDPVQPRFFLRSVQDHGASAAQGRPIFRDEECVQLLTPGGLNQPTERVTEEHRTRWPDHYAAFKRGNEMHLSGTPLEQWPVLRPAQVAELKALSVFTVEQAAQMSDSAVQRIGLGGQRIRERAKAFLDDAEACALTEQLNRENEQMRAQIASQERQISELRALVDGLYAKQTAAADAPSPIATHVPAHAPVDSSGGSSLDELPPPVTRRRIAQKEAA